MQGPLPARLSVPLRKSGRSGSQGAKTSHLHPSQPPCARGLVPRAHNALCLALGALHGDCLCWV